MGYKNIYQFLSGKKTHNASLLTFDFSSNMAQVREMRCPHCGKWTMWTGHVDDRCLYCAEFLEPKRFSREVEKKIRNEVVKESDYFFVKPTDKGLIRRYKLFFNSLRWWAFYLQIAFFGFVSLLLVLLSLATG